MDPLSIISFAGSSLLLLSCGNDLLSLAREIHRSDTGATKATERAALLTKRSRELSSTLLAVTPVSDDETQLYDAAGDCNKICQDLGDEVRKLTKATAKKSWAVSGYFAVRSRFGKDKIKEVEESLARCQTQISACLLRVMQADFKDAFGRILQQIDRSDARLEAVQQTMSGLQQGLKIASVDEQVVSQLKEVMGMNEAHLLRLRQQALLDTLRFHTIDQRFAGIVQPHEETCRWIFDSPPGPVNHPSKLTSAEKSQIATRQGFVAWLKDECSEPETAVYHILGKPGAGKSTLMKYLCRQERVRQHLEAWAGHKKLVMSSFYFWKPGVDIQKNQEGLIRCLLYRIFSKAPELITIAFPHAWVDHNQGSHGLRELLDAENCKVALKLLLQSLHTYDEHRFVLFLDGLDEFEDDHETKYSLVSLIQEWVKASQGNIKIVVSSRHYVEFEAGFGSSPGFHLQDLTRSDIEVVVSARMAKVQAFSDIVNMDDSSLSKISTAILDGAQGVFLWVHLVLNIVESSMGQGDSPEQLHRKIDSLPDELELLIQRIFEEIDASDLQKAYRTLHIVIKSYSIPRHWNGPATISIDLKALHNELRLVWYSFWDDIAQDPEYVLKQPLTTESRAETSRRLVRARRQVYGVCKGLIDVVDNDKSPMESYLNISHRSVYEYLQRPHVAAISRYHCNDFDPAYMRSQLFFACAKLVASPSSNRSAFETLEMCRQFRMHPEIYEVPFSAFQTLHAPGSRRFFGFLDHLLSCLESRQKSEIAIYEENEGSRPDESSYESRFDPSDESIFELSNGEPDGLSKSSHHTNPLCVQWSVYFGPTSDAVRVSLHIACYTLLSEYVVLHKARYARIFREFHSQRHPYAGVHQDCIHLLPSFPQWGYIVDREDPFPIEYVRDWLQILDVLGAEGVVHPRKFVVYMGTNFCDYLMIIRPLPTRLNDFTARDQRWLTWISSLPVASAIFLMHILHGGYLNFSMHIAPSAYCCELQITEDSEPYRYPVKFAHGCFSKDLHHEVTFRDLVEMFFAGKALEKVQELIRERELHAELDDSQASLRVRRKFGSALQLWEEFRAFEDENPYHKSMSEYQRKRENPEGREPIDASSCPRCLRARQEDARTRKELLDEAMSIASGSEE